MTVCSNLAVLRAAMVQLLLINSFLRMIFLKTDDEIELLRKSNLLVAQTLGELAKIIKPGVTTKDLDKVAEEFIRDNGATPTLRDS